MNEINPRVTTEKPAGRPPRLRVDISGLSEETRRELGLIGDEALNQYFPQVGEKKPSDRSHAAAGPAAVDPSRVTRKEDDQNITPNAGGMATSAPRSGRAFPIADSGAGVGERLEQGKNSDVLEQRRSPPSKANKEGRRQKAEELFGRSRVIDTSPGAGNQSGENQFPEEEGRQWSQGVGPLNGTASSRAEQGRDVHDRKSGSESFGEGYNQTLAGGSTLLRPGLTHSGVGETRRDTVSTPAPELPPAGSGHAPPNTREESDRLQELHAAVSQDSARHQQLYAAVLQRLRDSARLHTAQRAELDRLAAQVRMLLGQSANAGFNRQ